MTTITIMQGDSYMIFLELTQNGIPIQEDMVDEIEVCIGTTLRYTYTSGQVLYDASTLRWAFRPTQAETLALSPSQYDVTVRVKYKSSNLADVKGKVIGRIRVADTPSKEVL